MLVEGNQPRRLHMYDFIYMKIWKRQHSSDRKQINIWQGLGVGGGEFWSNEISILIVEVVTWPNTIITILRTLHLQ